jgi:hypothetical protein
MKKFLFFIALLFTASSCFAVTMPVESLTSVTSVTDYTDYNAKVLKATKFSNDFVIPQGAIVNMDIVKIVPARNGKRPAYMVVKPVFMEVPLTKEELNPPYVEKSELYYFIKWRTEYSYGFDWEELPEPEPRTTKYVMIDDRKLSGRTTTIKFTNKEDIKQNLKQNKKEYMKKAGAAVGKKALTTIAPGSEQLYQISKGLIKPEEGKSRLESATGNVIEESPLKYLKKGAEINIKEGDIITLKMHAGKQNKLLERLNNII